MPTERYYYPFPLIESQMVVLKDNEFHHLCHVMRQRIGDKIEIVNGEGSLAQTVLEEMKRNQATLRILSVHTEKRQNPSLILTQAIPKQNRLDYILEKGTELGVDIFQLYPGDLSQKKELFPSQLERAEAVCIAAMKQCGRLYLPQITLLPPISKWKPFNVPVFFGDLDCNASVFQQAWSQLWKPEMSAEFITGPESGFTTDEITLLKNLGAQGVKLHTNILRTDTASICALSLMSHWICQT